MLKLGWFSTGRGEGSQGLLRLVHDQIASGELPASMEFVFCNREPGEAEGSDQFHDLVNSCGVPLVTLSSQRFRRERGARTFDDVRAEYDQEVIKRLEGSQPDLVVLAGYMLFTAAELCQKFTMINLHPAPPGGPVGTWQAVIWQLIEEQANEAGSQIQRATMDWDRGPILTFCTFPIRGQTFDPLWEHTAGRASDDLKATYGEELPIFQRIREEGVKREQPLLVETIRAFALGKVKVTGRSVTDAEGQPISGYSLNEEIEGWIKRDAGGEA